MPYKEDLIRCPSRWKDRDKSCFLRWAVAVDFRFDKSQEAAVAQHTAPLPLSTWPACWNGTCPFITGEIRSDEEEERASAGTLVAVPTSGENEMTGTEAGRKTSLRSTYTPSETQIWLAHKGCWTAAECGAVSKCQPRLQVCSFNNEGVRKSGSDAEGKQWCNGRYDDDEEKNSKRWCIFRVYCKMYECMCRCVYIPGRFSDLRPAVGNILAETLFNI